MHVHHHYNEIIFTDSAVLTVDNNVICMRDRTIFTCTQPGNRVQWLVSLGPELSDPNPLVRVRADEVFNTTVTANGDIIHINLTEDNLLNQLNFTSYGVVLEPNLVNVSGGEAVAILALTVRQFQLSSLGSNISVVCYEQEMSTGDTLFLPVAGKACTHIIVPIILIPIIM